MLVGLCGYARCGKDTAAQALPEFKRYSLAGPLKKAADGMVVSLLLESREFHMAQESYTITHPELFKQLVEGEDYDSAMIFVAGVKDEYKAKLRPLYVGLGAGLRSIISDFWIQRLGAQIAKASPNNAVITDVRYLNEVKYILDKGGKVLLIKRPGVQAANDEELRSFTEIFDAVNRKEVAIIEIENDSDTATLHERVKAAIEIN